MSHSLARLLAEKSANPPATSPPSEDPPSALPSSTSTFSDLGLSEPLLESLDDLDLDHPTPFQEMVMPSLLDQRDLLARVPNESGEQMTYALPLIERLVKDGPTFNPTALVLLPTRELAIRTHEEFFQFSARGTLARVLGAFEGKPLTSQFGPLKHGTDIVIGTPARVLEHVKRRTLRIEQLKILVLDQFDEILALGLSREIEKILENTPKTRQTIIFSEFIPPRLTSIARQNLNDPVLIGVEPDDLQPEETSQGPAIEVVNLYFSVGKSAGVTPRDLVGAITNEGGLSGELIGNIKIKQNFSLVAVPAGESKEIIRKLRSSHIRGRKAKIRLERF